MKIFDCFTYFDEDLILDIRLNVLDKYVDKFVIVESGEDHQGRKKKKNFKIKNFKKFKKKIIYLYFEKFDKNLDSWGRENFQRNFIKNGIDEAHENDLIIISDVDEIPNLKKFNPNKENEKFFVFKQKLYYYKLNLLARDEIWHGSKACKKKYLRSPQWLRSLKTHKKYPFWRIDKIKFNYINNGGWHFSFVKNYKKIQKKIKSYAHVEYNKPEITNLKNIKKNVDDQKDIFNRNIIFKKVKVDSTYPIYVRKNLIKFKNFIL